MDFLNIKSNKFMKAGIGYTAGNFLIKGITFLTVPIFSRLLTPEEYGMVNIYISYETIISLIIGLGLHASIKSAKYQFENLNEYCSSILRFSLRNLLVVLIIANVFFGFYEQYLDMSRLIINLLLIQGFCDSVILSYNSRISLDYQYIKFLVISIVNTIINIGLSLILIIFVFSENRYLGRIIGLSTSTIVITIYIIYYFFKLNPPSRDKQYVKFGLQFSLPLVPHGLSQVLLSQFDRIMIKSMVGVGQAGIYSFCSNISLIPTVIFNSIDQVWMTWFFERMDSKDYSAIDKRSKVMLIVFSLVICFFTAFSPEMIKILAPRSYWDSINCVIPIVLSVYFVFLYSFPSYIEYFMKKTKMIALGSVLAALLNVILNYILIKKFGYIAAAYTTLFAYIMYFIYHWVIARKILNQRIYDGKFFLLIIISVLIQGFLEIIVLPYMILRICIFMVICLILCIILYKVWKQDKAINVQIN